MQVGLYLARYLEDVRGPRASRHPGAIGDTEGGGRGAAGGCRRAAAARGRAAGGRTRGEIRDQPKLREMGDRLLRPSLALGLEPGQTFGAHRGAWKIEGGIKQR